MDAEPSTDRRADRCRAALRVGPFLIVPVGGAVLVGLCVLAESSAPLRRFLDGPAQAYADALGPPLLAVAMTVFAVHAAVARKALSTILVALSAALLLREIHFEWTHRGIYPMLAAVAGWAWLWRRRLAEDPLDARQVRWLAATMGAYVVAFLLYRRAFQFVPGEAAYHNVLEEGMETVSHAMLIATSLRSPWRRPAKADPPVRPRPDAV